MTQKSRMILAALVVLFLTGCGQGDAKLECFLVKSDLLLKLPSTALDGAPFKSVDFSDWCIDDLLGPDVPKTLGNADSWPGDGDERYSALGKNRKWREAWGASINVYAVSPKGNYLPYLKQAQYREVDDCALEMRIYKRDILEEGLKPLILIHGGGWEYRGISFAGAEALVSHYTERGYAVFMPFYQLISNRDGPSACQNSDGQAITKDIEDAFDWVMEHGAVVGADTTMPVTLVGQSSGANLAGWLSLMNTSDVEKVILYYPPIGFRSFLSLYQEGFYDGRFKDALETLSLYSNDPNFAMANVDMLDMFVLANSLPYQIRENKVEHPPYFIMHGNEDERVPVEQSTYMCAALENIAPDQASTDGGRYTCGADNILHIIGGANHGFDLRCLTEIIPGFIRKFLSPSQLMNLCPSSIKAVPAAQDAINDSFRWLTES